MLRVLHTNNQNSLSSKVDCSPRKQYLPIWLLKIEENGTLNNLGPQIRQLRFFLFTLPLNETERFKMAKSFHTKSILVKNDSHLYPLQFYIDDNIVENLKKQKIKRLQVSINGHKKITGSLISGGDHQYFFKINKTQMKKFSLSIGDEASLEIIPDESEYGMPLPPEFTAIWEIDDEAKSLFHSLTPGKQRNLIYLVDKVKSLEIRARKATIIMEHLKINAGQLDFKVLNESLKVR